MEQSLDRPLTRREHIHHRDGDKLNNSLENLELLDISDHEHLHASRGRFMSATEAECRQCHGIKPHSAFSRRAKTRSGIVSRCKACHALNARLKHGKA